MKESETDAADQVNPQVPAKPDATSLWGRYRKLPRNVFAIGLVSLLNDASSEIIYPLLPVFLSLTLGASPAVIGLIEGAAESISSLLKLFAGYFSDRLGKRKAIVVVGYALANLMRPLLAFTTSWHQVLAIRLADRVGKGIRTAPRDAMIADCGGRRTTRDRFWFSSGDGPQRRGNRTTDRLSAGPADCRQSQRAHGP